MSWCLLGVVLGCSGRDDTERSLTGSWCGTPVTAAAECVGDEVMYVELQESGGKVTGGACEAFGKECYALQAGVRSGQKVTYFYEFAGYRVTADLDFDLGNGLSGSYFSTKCGCEVPVTLHRVP